MLPLLLACMAPPPGGPVAPDAAPEEEVDDDVPNESLTLEVLATAVPTVFHASVAGPPSATAMLEYGVDGAFDHAIAATEGEDGRYTTALMGIAAGERWSVRVRLESTAGVEFSPAVELPVVTAPDWLPEVAVTEGEVSARGGFRLLSNTLPGLGMVGIVDGAGRYVWWAAGTEGQGTMTTSARMSPDGASVDWLEVGTGAGEVLHRTRLDGSEQLDVVVPGAHHDFLAIADDRWAVLVRDIRQVDGVSVVGDALVEVEADGTSRTVWTAWDTYELDASTLHHGDEGGLWWTHANSLAFDGARYWVSLYEFDAVAVIEASTGALLAQLGGEGSTATLDGQPFSHQHSPVLSGDRLLVFDNSDPDRQPTISAAREYVVDADLVALREVWSFEHPDAGFAQNFGNARRDSDGAAFVSWGNLATLDEVDASGELTWRLQATDGTTFGYVQWAPALGGATW